MALPTRWARDKAIRRMKNNVAHEEDVASVMVNQRLCSFAERTQFFPIISAARWESAHAFQLPALAVPRRAASGNVPR